MVHSGIKPHVCSLCPSKFRKTHHLRRHMLVHTGERPYGCDFCDRTFTSSGNLNKHRAIHLGQKNFECEYCSKKFTQSSNLTKHKAIHLRQQQKSEVTAPSAEEGVPNPINILSTTKKRGRKKQQSSVALVQILPTNENEVEHTMEIPLEGADEGESAVLHIVGGEGDEEVDGDTGEHISYEIIAEGDVIIEI